MVVLFSKFLFRLTFLVLATLYLVVITKFIDPKYYTIDVSLSFEAVGLTLLVCSFLAMVFRKKKLSSSRL